ncbi:SURF1 family protein [Brevundimonas lenta]|uniref:SURF1-like protein n=1 Tax=Brevundimonas lenta TaxID=424796 RepID=A0A7W6JBI7_9CAUL|nr:SURF1 family protein [Brevundimonas lenta]MBB4082027.1 surfeit locus 1 family protein [Brevundimonas lenta]
MTESRVRFPWGLTIVSALALALLISLGVWQVQRLHWKTGLIAEAEAAAAHPPVALAALRAERGVPEFRKVALVCPGLATAPFVELQSIHDGQAGVRLISACRPAGSGETLLLDRGFVADIISARPPAAASEAPVRIVAEVRQTPAAGPMAAAPNGSHFYARDNNAMAKVLGVAGSVAPETFFAVTSSNPEWQALTPSAPPAAFSNNHLGYALTWFGLALALAGFYIALLRRKLSLKQPRSASEASGKEKS